MAADNSSMSVNGNYGAHMGYDYSGANANSHNGHASTQSPAPSKSTSGQAELPKDEVGWYFVEQYYTTLSRNPEKLYLFYNKRSQLVIGQETDKVDVCVGQRAINDRIKGLEFQDCKIRVTNVDAQASDANIVIQVIGEISHKSQPHQKFTQTFILAGQTNGYFVLNDIFRYIVEEEDESKDTQPAAQPEPAHTQQYQPTHSQESTQAGLTSSSDPVAVERSAHEVDEQIEKKLSHSTPHHDDSAATNGTHHHSHKHAHKQHTASDAQAKQAQASDEAPAVNQDTEGPKDPEPTPITSPVKQNAKSTASAPSQPPKSTAPKTWANLAAAAHKVVAPASAAAQSSASPEKTPSAAPAQSAAASTPAPTPSAPAAASAKPNDATPSSTAEPAQQDEWTSVGDNKRQQSKAPPAPETQQGRAYVKNVQEGVTEDMLRTQLSQFGELTLVEISRPKSCAFVDFKTAEGYKAAVDANPHRIGESELNVETRRIKPAGFQGYPPRGGMRGGRGGQGQGAGRGGQQGRGGFAPRGRGAAGAPARGRGGAQAA